jgi:DNA excision repair protein ERCC-1
MQLLPGLGPIKVRRIKDAFEKPFYPRSAAIINEGTTAAEQGPSIRQSQLDNRVNQTISQSPKSSTRGLDLALDPPAVDAEEGELPEILVPVSRFELNEDHQQLHRDPSPIWDIELDLNSSECSSQDGEEPLRKRRK